MASQDSTNFDAALKDYFTDDAVRDLGYEDNPLHAMLEKLESFSGRRYVQPVQYGRPQGRSADSSKALANKTPAKYEDFNVTMASDYWSSSITRQVMKESRNDRGAFLRAKIREVESGLKTLVQS